MTATHSSFTIERVFHAAPCRVFQAFADPVAKARWFTGPKECGKFVVHGAGRVPRWL